MSKIILIIFLFLTKTLSGSSKWSILFGDIQWQQPFQRYCTNIKERMTGGPECSVPSGSDRSRTYSCGCMVPVWRWCLSQQHPKLFILGIVCLQRFLATRWPEHVWHPVSSICASTDSSSNTGGSMWSHRNFENKRGYKWVFPPLTVKYWSCTKFSCSLNTCLTVEQLTFYILLHENVEGNYNAPSNWNMFVCNFCSCGWS